MKVYGNLAAMMSAVMLMGALLFAQRDYQTSFGGGATAQSATADDTGSLAAYVVDHQIVVMK